MGRKIGLTTAFALINLVLQGLLWAGDVQSFHVSQAVVRLPEVKTYLDATDGNDNSVAGLAPSQLTASLGGRSLQPSATLDAFEKTGEGVAYIFAIDTSGSVRPEHFKQIQNALKTWIGSIGPNDRVALLSFSDKSEIVSDFTKEKAKASASVDQLKLGGKRTLLHLALSQALDMGTRRDAGLPDRRVILVLSDGKDEGSGLAVDDILHKAQTLHIPIYAVGYSNLPTPKRRQYLDVLHRFALLSGGAYSEPGEGELQSAFAGLKKAATRVLVAKFHCADCQADGKTYRLEVQLNAGSRSFSDGFELSVFPPEAPNAKSAPQPQWWKRWWIYAAAGVLLVLVVVVIVVVRKRNKAAEELQAGFPAPDTEGWSIPTVADGGGLQATESMQAQAFGKAVLRLQFTTLRGSKRGEMKEVSMRSSGQRESSGELVIGRAPGSDLTLGDDAVSSRHCVLVWNDGRLVIRDLKSSNGTSLNGVPVRGDQPVESGDVISVGHNEYRVIVVPDRV